MHRVKKLTPMEIQKIRELLHVRKDKELAAQFGVALATVWRIRNKIGKYGNT